MGRACCGRPHARGEDDEAQLRCGRGRQQLLEVALGEGDPAEEDGGQRPGPRGRLPCPARRGEQRRDPEQQVAAEGDHRGGVQQRRDRAGSVHGPGKPEGERELGCLAEGRHEDPSGGHVAPAAVEARQRGEGEVGAAGQRGGGGQVEAEISGARRQESGRPRGDAPGVGVAVADEGVGGRAHHLPPQQQGGQARGQHGQRRGRGEQQHEAREPGLTGLGGGRGREQHERRHGEYDGQDHRRRARGRQPQVGAQHEARRDAGPLRRRDDRSSSRQSNGDDTEPSGPDPARA